MTAADDVIQEIFLYVWEHKETINESTPSRAYLYRAAHNAALNDVRRPDDVPSPHRDRALQDLDDVERP